MGGIILKKIFMSKCNLFSVTAYWSITLLKTENALETLESFAIENDHHQKHIAQQLKYK